MSQSKVSRIETGRHLPTVVDVQALLDALAVDAETREELLQLASAANTDYEDIREAIRTGLHHRQRELAALELGAEHIRFFLPAMYTGLLQTPEYMRVAMSPAVDPSPGTDVSQALAVKLERQSVLHDRSKRFEFLLTEPAARWRITDSSAMALQIDRVISLSRLPNVGVGVVPMRERSPEGPMHTFTLYDEKLVTVELFSGRLVLRDRKDVEYYGELFDFFATRAVFKDDARALLAGWADEFRGEP